MNLYILNTPDANIGKHRGLMALNERRILKLWSGGVCNIDLFNFPLEKNTIKLYEKREERPREV